MALYLDESDFALFSSTDLKEWQRLGDVSIPGTSECPEFFEIAVDGDGKNTRWVFYGGNGRYLIGRFDGKTFTPESGPHSLSFGNCFYASQTFSDIPAADGRRLLIPWGTVALPGMPFNQMMGFPVELTLRTTEQGLRLSANSVKEIESLRVRSHRLKLNALAPGENPLAEVKGELFDISTEITLGNAEEIGFKVRGIPVAYDVEKRELTCQANKAPLDPIDGKIRLRLLVDRASVEIFGNDGRLYMPMGMMPPEDDLSLALYAKSGSAGPILKEVHEFRSAWPSHRD